MAEAKKERKTECRGEKTAKVNVTGYGGTRQTALDNMMSIIAMNAPPDTCTGGCSGGDDCLPLPNIDDEEDIDCKPYYTKKGHRKWRARYVGDVRFACECVEGD